VATERTDGRVERGNQTRRTILRHTMDVASREGLEALSLGRIALDLKVSKSGVFALFGSKEELQLATVRAARRVFVDSVVAPAHEAAEGLPRVWRLSEAWLRYSRERVFAGGCFFQTVVAEFTSRPGAVRDALRDAEAEWRRHVEELLGRARELGHLRPAEDPAQLAFELNALLTAANRDSLLLDTEAPYARARAAVRARLRAASADPALIERVIRGTAG